MQIAIASDHAGFPLKQFLIDMLRKAGHDVQDYGTRSAESVDFSDFVVPAALAVAEGKAERAILVDGAGYPSGIVANFIEGVYAAVANDPFSAKLCREHSDANVLCIGGKVIGEGLAAEIVKIFLETKFAGGKYAARVEKVKALAKKHRRPAAEQPIKVLTLEDVREAIAQKRPLMIGENTMMTPGVQDFSRGHRP